VIDRERIEHEVALAVCGDTTFSPPLGVITLEEGIQALRDLADDIEVKGYAKRGFYDD